MSRLLRPSARCPSVSQRAPPSLGRETLPTEETLHSRHVLMRRTSRVTRIHQQQRSIHDNSNHRNSIHPYSDSLPSPGHEWCSRCGIRTHAFQKPKDSHNPCLDFPRLFGFGVCTAAKQYYQRQVTSMLLLSIFVFGMAPVYNRAVTHSEEDHLHDSGHLSVGDREEDDGIRPEDESTLFQVHGPTDK